MKFTLNTTDVSHFDADHKPLEKSRIGLSFKQGICSVFFGLDQKEAQSLRDGLTAALHEAKKKDIRAKAKG